MKIIRAAYCLCFLLLLITQSILTQEKEVGVAKERVKYFQRLRGRETSSNRISKLLKVKEQIKEVAAGLRKRIFEAKPGYMVCNYCAYNQICPFAMMK